MKIVGLLGSLNPNSSTGKALNVALEAARAAGAEVELYSLREKPLPIYDPAAREQQYAEERVKYFVQLMTEADGFILGSPEYHNGVSGVFKNALDFVGSTQFAGKPTGLISSAGGAVATNTLNQMLTMIRSLHGYVVPQFGSVSYGGSFTEDGKFTDADTQARFEKIGTDVAHLVKAFQAVK
jgi:FMN reductase